MYRCGVGRIVRGNQVEFLQHVDYVRYEEKMTRILDALQKTPPPVLIFAEKKEDVDRLHEYLLLKVMTWLAGFPEEAQFYRASKRWLSTAVKTWR